METVTTVKKLIVPNMKLWVSIKGTSRLFLTRVYDVYPESFTIYPPTDNGEKLTVTKKTQLEFMFMMDSGKYYFTTNAIGIIKDKFTLLAINLPKDIVRNEMREFYRVDLLRHLPVFLKQDIEDNHTGKFFKKGDMVTMVCTDISGGGLKLLSPVYLHIDDKVDIDLSGFIDDIGRIEGTVVRQTDSEDEYYTYGVMFTSLSESDRDKIVKRVFMRQTEQRKLNG